MEPLLCSGEFNPYEVCAIYFLVAASRVGKEGYLGRRMFWIKLTGCDFYFGLFYFDRIISFRDDWYFLFALCRF
jgi:hypothetical protein